MAATATITLDKEYLTLGQAAKLCPGRPSVSSLHRWATHGIRGNKLGSVRVGSKIFTTPEWVAEFLARCNETDDDRLERDGC